MNQLHLAATVSFQLLALVESGVEVSPAEVDSWVTSGELFDRIAALLGYDLPADDSELGPLGLSRLDAEELLDALRPRAGVNSHRYRSGLVYLLSELINVMQMAIPIDDSLPPREA